jgi:NhaP-type Na+/H+ or K+/H+ antiporter
MKIVEWIIAAALWICGVIALVFLGWCIKGYTTKKNICWAPINKAEEAILNKVDAVTKKKE